MNKGFRHISSIVPVSAIPRIVIAASLALCFSIAGKGQTPPSPEYQVKAAFLYNFTQFITWPAAVFPNENAPFVIGILGEDPFNGYLQKIVSGETVNGHKINVKRCRDAGEALDCHLLFIRYENSEQTKKTLAGLHGREMLTVGEDPNFTVMGGILRFFTRDNKIRFEINLPAARDANLDISSKLLRVAEIYPPGRG